MKNEKFKEFFYKLRERKKEEKREMEIIELDGFKTKNKRSTDDDYNIYEPKKQSKIKRSNIEQIEQRKIERGIEREKEFQNRLRIQKETTLLVTGNKSINPFFTKKAAQPKREHPRIVDPIGLPGKEFYKVEKTIPFQIQSNFKPKTVIKPLEFSGKTLLDYREKPQHNITTTTSQFPSKPKRFSNPYFKSLLKHLRAPQDIKSCILLGPTGSGKSSAVHKACEILHIPLIEINTTQKHTSKTLMALFRNKKCVYLIDDFDIQFKCDQGFSDTILRILKTDSYKMVFTMTERMDLDIAMECYKGKCFGNEIAKRLFWDRCVIVDGLDALLSQWNISKYDFRGLLNNVDFFCRFSSKNGDKVKEIIRIEDIYSNSKKSKTDSKELFGASDQFDNTATSSINDMEPISADVEYCKGSIEIEKNIELKEIEKDYIIGKQGFELNLISKEIISELTFNNTEHFKDFERESKAICSEFSDDDSYQSEVEPEKPEKQFTIIKIPETDRKLHTISELSKLLDLKSAIKYTMKPKEVYLNTIGLYNITTRYCKCYGLNDIDLCACDQRLTSDEFYEYIYLKHMNYVNQLQNIPTLDFNGLFEEDCIDETIIGKMESEEKAFMRLICRSEWSSKNYTGKRKSRRSQRFHLNLSIQDYERLTVDLYELQE